MLLRDRQKSTVYWACDVCRRGPEDELALVCLDADEPAEMKLVHDRCLDTLTRTHLQAHVIKRASFDDVSIKLLMWRKPMWGIVPDIGDEATSVTVTLPSDMSEALRPKPQTPRWQPDNG